VVSANAGRWCVTSSRRFGGGVRMATLKITGYAVAPRLSVAYQFDPNLGVAWATDRGCRYPAVFCSNLSATCVSSSILRGSRSRIWRKTTFESRLKIQSQRHFGHFEPNNANPKLLSFGRPCLESFGPNPGRHCCKRHFFSIDGRDGSTHATPARGFSGCLPPFTSGMPPIQRQITPR